LNLKTGGENHGDRDEKRVGQKKKGDTKQQEDSQTFAIEGRRNFQKANLWARRVGGGGEETRGRAKKGSLYIEEGEKRQLEEGGQPVYQRTTSGKLEGRGGPQRGGRCEKRW